MLSARKQIRIISLGEIVTLDIMKTIQAFTALIAEKKQTVNPHDVSQSIGFVLQQNMKTLNDFKTGILNETDFTEQMIAALEKATEVKLTVEEFNNAWNVMNPKFEQFKNLLQQAVEYNNQPKQKIVFISFTSPKDIRNLINELETNEQNYRVVDNQLIEISGIQLHTTYATQQTKAELIETTIKKLNSKTTTSILADSMGSVVSLGQTKEFELPDIKYIRGVNDIKDPILKEDLNQINQEVEKKIEGFFVDTLLWMKKEVTLADVLHNQQSDSKQIYVAKL